MKKISILIAISLMFTIFIGCRHDGYEYTQELNIIDDNYRNYYEVFLYSFYDSDGDGIGDINGLRQKLDYITDMGFNGIWLMPIMPSPTYHKYDVTDYYEIDKQYGTLDDFQALIAECDERGIKVIIDLVLNHTSAQHPWFMSACESIVIPPCGEEVCIYTDKLCREHNPYCDYYNFTDEYQSSYEYHRVGNSDYFYECVFWDQMPDLNLADNNLRRDIEDITKFWLDLGVGGFRLDAVKEFYTGGTEKNIEVLDWISNYAKSIDDDCYIVAEVWDSFTQLTQYYGSGVDSVFNFAFAEQTGKIVKTINYTGLDNSAKAFGEALVYSQDRISSFNSNAIDAPFFTNHDTARGAGYFSYDEQKLKMAAGMNLTMNGSVFVYYGEEIGMSGSGIDENKRMPMLWSDTDEIGITNPPANASPQDHRFPDVQQQLADDSSIINYFKRGLRLRNENPEIARGFITAIDVGDIDVCAIKKTYQDSDIYIIYNISEQDKEIHFSKVDYGHDGIRGYLATTDIAPTLKGDALMLPPYSIVLLK